MPTYQNQDPEAIQTRADQQVLYEHILNQVQGAFGTDATVEFVASEAAGTSITPGRICYLDPDTGNFVQGLQHNYLPFYAKPAQGYNDQTPAGNLFADTVLALPAVAAYRLQTTEFVDETYAPNDAVTAVFEGDNAGQLTPGTYYEDTICGIVLKSQTNVAERDVLEVISFFLPSANSSSVAGTPW